MFIPRCLLSIISIIPLLLLCWTVPGAAVEGTCQDATVNDPIGIDFGPQFIIASYAHSPANFTPLALLSPDEYQLQVMQLWGEYFDRSNLKRLYSPNDPNATLFKLLKEVVRQRLSPLIAGSPTLNHPYVQWVVTTTRWAYDSLFSQIQRLIGPVLLSQRRDPVTLSSVRETFTSILKDIKASALADHGVNITYAVAGVPDFFNDTLSEVLIEAGRQVGIEIPNRALPRSSLGYLHNPEIPPDSRVLVLHQGHFHCGIRLSQVQRSPYRKELPERYLPLDPWGSQNIYRQLVTVLLESNPALETQISVGADKSFLTTAALQARAQLKNYNPAVEILGLDTPSANDGNGNGDDRDHLDEIPLDLDSWWVYGSNPGVKLTGEQVRAVEDDFVKTLGNTIYTFLQASRQQITGTESMQPEKINRAVILTDHFDGDLLRRAIKEALGNDIPILGGTLQNVTMVADSAARLAFTRKENLLLRERSRRRPRKRGRGRDEL